MHDKQKGHSGHLPATDHLVSTFNRFPFVSLVEFKTVVLRMSPNFELRSVFVVGVVHESGLNHFCFVMGKSFEMFNLAVWLRKFLGLWLRKFF